MPVVLPHEVTIDTPMEDFPEGERLYQGIDFLLWHNGQLRNPPFSEVYLYKDKNCAFYFYAATDRLICERPLVTESLNKFVVHKLWMSVSSGVGVVTIEEKLKKIALKNIKLGLPHVKLPFGLVTPSEVEFICD